MRRRIRNRIKCYLRSHFFICFFSIYFSKKPTDEIGKAYVEFLRVNLEQMRQKVSDELYILSIMEVSCVFLKTSFTSITSCFFKDLYYFIVYD
ncbi:unnamed protein product [Schistosoma curassoni]|uniref:Uncharacterized protein n=1 Tax=Schistosoma curassoni TaxID=6186 RepID=A0A183JUF8_9TREM|nr:unnamed protein product [Schistosoma curassoni]